MQWLQHNYSNVLELLHSVLESTEEGLAAVYVGSPHLDHSGTEEGAIFATEHAKPPSMAPGGTENEYWLAMCIEVSSCLDLEQPLFCRQHFDDEVYSSRLCMENKPVMDQLFTQQCTFKLLLNCWFFPD